MQDMTLVRLPHLIQLTEVWWNHQMCTYRRTYLLYMPWFVPWIRKSVLRSKRPEKENHFWRESGVCHKHILSGRYTPRHGIRFIHRIFQHKTFFKIWNSDHVPYLQYEGFVNPSLGIVLIQNVFQITKCWADQSGRSPKVVALFFATNFSSYIIELLQLHDKIQIKCNYAWIHDNIAIRRHLMI